MEKSSKTKTEKKFVIKKDKLYRILTNIAYFVVSALIFITIQILIILFNSYVWSSPPANDVYIYIHFIVALNILLERKQSLKYHFHF